MLREYERNDDIMAHKKGMGSTRNGRDSESKRLGVNLLDGNLEEINKIIDSIKKILNI